MTRFMTSGLDHGKLVGASASTRFSPNEASLAVVSPFELGVVDQSGHGPADGEVGLHQPVEERAFEPSRIIETAIPLLRLPVAATDRDPCQLVRERRPAADDGTRPSRESAGKACGLEARNEARDAGATRLGEQQIGRARGIDRAHPCDDAGYRQGVVVLHQPFEQSVGSSRTLVRVAGGSSNAVMV
jgi:hypothetical protein